MPKKRFSAEQVVVLLRQIEVSMSQGKSTPVACREAGISQQSFDRWRKEHGGLEIDQAKRFKEATVVIEQWRKQHQPAALLTGLSPASPANSNAEDNPSGSKNADAIVSIPLVQNIRQVNHYAAQTFSPPLSEARGSFSIDRSRGFSPDPPCRCHQSGGNYRL